MVSPEVYTGEGSEDVCRIDPRACPAVHQRRSLAAEQISLSGPLAAAPAVRRVRYGYAFEAETPGPAAPTPPTAIPVGPGRASAAEQLEIEAKVELEVQDIERSRAALGALTAACGGQLMNEAVENNQASRGASLSLRIPSGRVREFLLRLRAIGRLRSSRLETRDVSRSLADAEVLLHNLQQALSRYTALLAKATSVAEATTVEGELERVRTQLERVQSDLAWSRDRVARATIYVTLGLPRDEPVAAPQARLYPGVRGALFVDVPPRSLGNATAFAGAGLSLQWSRALDLELDLLKDLSRARAGVADFSSLTLGTALYSDFFGGGRRRALNPYVGFRLGYAHAPGQNLLPLGGMLGVELYSSPRLRLALDVRAYALLGRKQGADLGLEPSLGFNIAY
jgi:hypothetical protein